MLRPLALIALCLAATTLYAERFSHPVAVFVAPMPSEMSIARANYSDRDFMGWQDEGEYNFEQAEVFLKGLGYDIVHSTDLIYTFVDNAHYEHRVDLHGRKYPWSIILFNGATPPRLFIFPQDPDAKAYLELGKQLGEKQKSPG